MAARTGGEATLAAEHRTAARVMTILELVVASNVRGMRLGDLATALNAPKSSLHALTRALVSTGYLREEDNRYLVGPAISGLMTAEPATALLAFRPILSALVGKWNETAMLARLVGDSVVYVDSVQPDVLIRVKPMLNKRMPLWPRSSGKVFLASMEPKRLEAYIQRYHRHPAEAEDVCAQLAETCAARFGLNIGQSVTEHIGIAVPVRVGPAPVTTAIAIAGPKSRMADRVDEIAVSLLEAADAISS